MTNAKWPLYNASLEHDSCGVGLVVQIDGTPSRSIVEKALAGLVNLTHRGAVGADARTGDGAGIMIQVPHTLFADTLARAGHPNLAAGEYGVAMLFLPRDHHQALAAATDAVTQRGQQVGDDVMHNNVKQVAIGRFSVTTRRHRITFFIRSRISLSSSMICGG